MPYGKRNFVADGAGFGHSLHELDMLKFPHLLLVSTVILLFTRKCIENSTKQGSLCRCLASPEANEMSSNGNAHVHCPSTVCAVCNCKRNCEKEDDIWIPERGPHNQNISFASILAVASGIWLIESLTGGKNANSFYIVWAETALLNFAQNTFCTVNRSGNV